ncbi:type II secretion system F family protein [Piscinibacter sp.]|uniref:type II secretion system F family protein n=1 Tax=Piscinibacter sp. TaxID=1903157 RepID=UPI002BDE3C7A|nr:type II secretion system F family protein [Albitalea sp.]HUG26549.1 type II secretion system F family protein [Albitalea sp.]
MDTSYVLFAVLLFVAVVLALEGAYQVWASKNSAEAKRVMARLQSLEGAVTQTTLSIERQAAIKRWNWLDDNMLRALPKGADMVRYLETSGTGRTAGEMLLYSAVLGAAGAAVPMLLAKPWTFSLFLGGVLASLPWFWLSRRRNQRMQLFERQIPEALDLMGRAMRAGQAFPTAVKMVGEEMPEPIGREFRVLFDETNFGIPQNEALVRLADRVPIPDLRYFVIAVMIQRESGGNLAELLDNIAAIVRARLKLLGEVRTLSAEGKLSAWILGLLPFAVGGVIQLTNPAFLGVLWTDPVGLKMVGGALVLMAVGVLWMRTIIRIRV